MKKDIDLLTKTQLYSIAKKHKHIHKRPISTMRHNELRHLVGGLAKHPQVGAGVIDQIKKFGQKVADKVKSHLFFPPNKLPGNSQRIFDLYKDKYITNIEVRREPVSGAISKFANWISKGEFDKKLKELGYDKAFHIYLLLRLSDGKQLLLEKNERVNLASGGSKGIDSEGQNVSLGGKNITLSDFMEKARQAIGDHNFFQYSFDNLNCQRFILDLLGSSGLLTSDIRKFIEQDAKAIASSIPQWASKIAQGATDAAGKISEVLTGQGKKKRRPRRKI